MSLNPENQPLEGLRVMVTRAQTGEVCRLSNILAAVGATPYRAPVIRVCPPLDVEALKGAILRLSDFKSIVFLSGNAIAGFLDSEAAMEFGIERALVEGSWNIYAIGRATADRLTSRGLHVRQAPDRYNSDGVADMLLAQPDCQPVLIVRADRGSNVLSTRLREANLEFEELASYRSLDVGRMPEECLDSMERGEIDWCTATSAAIAGNLLRLFGQRLEKTKIAAMSPAIAKIFEDHGMAVAATANQFTFEELVNAIVTEVHRSMPE